MRVLLTGGCGYIGGHVAIALIEAGHDVVILDNLSAGRADTDELIHRICAKKPFFVAGDVRDSQGIEKVISANRIEAVVHCAGLKVVGDSISNPISYFDNNVQGTLSLLKAMDRCEIRNLVFSSSATVYGEPNYLPLDENHPTSVNNPYGRTKLIVEEMLSDIARSDSRWRIGVLRYFNPVGAHSSGLLGDYSANPPSNIMPYIVGVGAGLFPFLPIFGGDYPTADGTGVRDYIHVSDLAAGHISAMEAVATRGIPLSTWNICTGTGYSVLDLVRTFERVNQVKVPVQIVERRPGDVASCYASPEKSAKELEWSAKLDLSTMCSSSWHFQTVQAARREEKFVSSMEHRGT